MSSSSSHSPHSATGHRRSSLGIALILTTVLSIAGIWVVYAIANSLDVGAAGDRRQTQLLTVTAVR